MFDFQKAWQKPTLLGRVIILNFERVDKNAINWLHSVLYYSLFRLNTSLEH